MEEQIVIDSARVKKLRGERSWSQEHLAAVAALSLRTIQRVESEGSGSLETRMAIASAFDVPVSSLVTEVSDAPASPAASSRTFPGKPLGIVFGLSGAMLGGSYAALGISGTPVEYGFLGAWLGFTCGIAGLAVSRYQKDPAKSQY